MINQSQYLLQALQQLQAPQPEVSFDQPIAAGLALGEKVRAQRDQRRAAKTLNGHMGAEIPMGATPPPRRGLGGMLPAKGPGSTPPAPVAARWGGG